jgi:hypothetical protein
VTDTDEVTVAPHPAKWSKAVLEAIAPVLEREYGDAETPPRLLDPYAGVGLDRLREIFPTAQWDGLEIEPEWAAGSPGTTQGDVLAMPWHGPTFHGLVTSCTYANRMADCHDAKDDSRRITYRHKLGRMPTEGSSAVMQWGPAYRQHHRSAWAACLARLHSRSLVIVNVSNHIRDGVEQRVVEFHLNEWMLLGATVEEIIRVPTPRMGFGANGDARVDAERLLVLRAPEKAGML